MMEFITLLQKVTPLCLCVLIGSLLPFGGILPRILKLICWQFILIIGRWPLNERVHTHSNLLKVHLKKQDKLKDPLFMTSRKFRFFLTPRPPSLSPFVLILCLEPNAFVLKNLSSL